MSANDDRAPVVVVRANQLANGWRRDRCSKWPVNTQADRRWIRAEAVHPTGEDLEATGVIPSELVGWRPAIVKTFAKDYMEHFVKDRRPPEILGRKPGQSRGSPERTTQIDHIGFDNSDVAWSAVSGDSNSACAQRGITAAKYDLASSAQFCSHTPVPASDAGTGGYAARPLNRSRRVVTEEGLKEVRSFACFRRARTGLQ
jgi:hypothetical protein